MENDDIVTWSKGYFLNWGDFKAQSNPSAYEDSSSHLKYHHGWTVNSEMIDGKIYFMINNIQLSTQFLRHLSWIRTQHASHDLLKHEQGHFDLAESLRPIIVESLLKKLTPKKFPTRGQNDEQRKQFAREDSGLIIAKELEKWDKKLSQIREKYDKETELGKNLTKQKEYDEKFQLLRK